MIREDLYTFFFYLLSLLAFLLAVGVVIERRLLRSAVSLIGVLACSVGLSLLLHFEFVAMIQVLVFIGGIVVLLIFGIMMTSQGHMYEQRPSLGRELIGVATAVIFFAGTTTAICRTDFDQVRQNLVDLKEKQAVARAAADKKLIETATHNDEKNVKKIGKRLLSNRYEGFIMPFEVISLLLLAAMISGIAIARKKIQEE